MNRRLNDSFQTFLINRHLNRNMGQLDWVRVMEVHALKAPRWFPRIVFAILHQSRRRSKYLDYIANDGLEEELATLAHCDLTTIQLTNDNQNCAGKQMRKRSLSQFGS